MDYYKDLIDAINGLKAKGYTRDFNLESDRLVCNSTGMHLFPEDFRIDEYHRFEGMSSTDDNSIIYAITASDGLKGTLVSAYGMYAEGTTEPMIRKLSMRH